MTTGATEVRPADDPGRGAAAGVADLPRPRLVGATTYQVLSLFSGIVWFTLLVTLLAVGFGTLVVWVGLPILVAALWVARGAAAAERWWLAATLDVDIPTPAPREPAGPNAGDWMRAALLDPARWREVAYLLLLLPLGVTEFAVALSAWAVTLGCLLFPAVYLLVLAPLGGTNVLWGWRVDSLPEAFALMALAAPMAALSVAAVRGMAVLHRALAMALLGPSRSEALVRRNRSLIHSRARAVEAAAAERRRIERDLHDGAQQRLVALAMDLGMAKAKFGSDPEAARLLVDEAHAEAKRAIAELRDLARGIHPAVLTDRGLDAALSALAGRSPVPVDVHVNLYGRLSPALEGIAYFMVAEALTNVARHAAATRAGVDVRMERDTLVVEVADDGHGGATTDQGSGLAGLADRAAGVDGTLTVTSPPGGPTTVRMELPCGS